MPLPKGINNNNFSPKGNSAPFTKGNTPPKGVGNGVWVSGYGSQRGEGFTNTAKTASVGAARQGIAQKTVSISGRLAKAARPAVAFVKGLGAIGLAKVFGLATAFVGLFAKGTSDGTLPDWVRDVGETQIIEPSPEPPFEGGQKAGRQYVVSWTQQQTRIPGCERIRQSSGNRTLVGPIRGVVINILDDDPFYDYDCFGLGNQDICYSVVGIGYGNNQTHSVYVNVGSWCSTGLRPMLNEVVITSVTRADGLPDTDEDLHDLSENATFSSPTTDLSNVSVSSTSNVTNDIRPTVKAAIPTVKPPPNLPKTSPTQRMLDSPSATPTALPTITPTPEKSVDDISEPDDKESIAPPVISTNKSIRADGTVTTTTTREATVEELRDINRSTTTALETVDLVKASQGFDGGIDAFVPSPNLPTQPNTVEETKRTPALPPNKLALIPPPIISGTPIDNNPDQIPTEKPSSPPPIFQTPPDLCASVCTPNIEIDFPEPEENCCAEMLAGLAALALKAASIESLLTTNISGEIITELGCNEEDETKNIPQSYSAPGLTGIHQLLQLISDNIVSTFQESCNGEGIVAFPAWWQVRLGSNVPQIVCVFRKASTYVYHSISIPHPASTIKPSEPLLPAYTKGNWQGMITCIDNSKFIINCETKAEAERMCNEAIALIDPSYLETPPRIYVGERKGQAVSVDPMHPTSIEYYESGQENSIPNWRAKVSETSSN